MFAHTETYGLGHRSRLRTPISSSFLIRELHGGHSIELLSEGRDAVAYGLPDRVLLEAEIGVGKTITQTSNSSPGDEWMTLLNLCWDLLCCFSE